MSWRSGQAYSPHLRERVRSTVDAGMGAYAAAATFQVNLSCISKKR
jgi:hypothetical protein